MKLILRFEAWFPDLDQWWREPGHLDRVLLAIDKHGFWEGLRLWNDRRWKTAPALQEILALSKTWDDRRSLDLSAVRSGPKRWHHFFHASLFAEHLGLSLGIGGELLEKDRHDAFSRAIALLEDLTAELSPPALPGRTLCIEASEVAVFTTMPPHSYGSWRLENLVEIHSRSFHRRVPHGDLKEVESLAAAPLPPGFTREDRGDLIALRYVDDISDEALVMQRLRERYDWYVKTLNLPER